MAALPRSRGVSAVSDGTYAAPATCIKHVFSAPLQDDTKVGFSIENLTGQPLRYLQRWENGRKTIQYLDHGQRGLLNFLASTTVLRNNKPYTVQLDDTTDPGGRGGDARRSGKHLALQIAGYKWLPSVSVDKLGVQFQELRPLPGRPDVAALFFGTEYLPPGQVGDRTAMANALRLIAEVVHSKGCRILRLRSTFAVKNSTCHKLKLLATVQDKLPAKKGQQRVPPGATTSPPREASPLDDDAPFELMPGEEFHIPLALLHQSALASNGRSLGNLFICPAEISAVETEMQTKFQAKFAVAASYSSEPISLAHAVGETFNGADVSAPEALLGFRNAASTTRREQTQAKARVSGKQLNCELTPVARATRSRAQSGARAARPGAQDAADNAYEDGAALPAGYSPKLPLYCYKLELQAHGEDQATDQRRANDGRVNVLQAAQDVLTGRLFNPQKDKARSDLPLHYTLVIHSPIVIENLLPSGAYYEIVNATTAGILWSSYVGPLGTKLIHTVPLNVPLLMNVYLRNCKSDGGVIIHKVKHEKERGGGFGRIQQALEGLLENEEAGDRDDGQYDNIFLVDLAGQVRPYPTPV